MSVTENEATAAIVTTEEGDSGDCQPCDAQSEASTVPATAEVSKGVASLPSPNKTGSGRQHVVYSILEESPPWTRQSFMDSMFSISSFQEDLGASPVSTSRLTPGLRRLCLEATPSLVQLKAERHSHIHQTTPSSLENETPPWMKASFMDYSITTPTEQGNTLELPSSTDIVVTVPLPDIVKLNSQNDTTDVECEGLSSHNAPPNGFSPSSHNEVNLPYRDSPVSAIASTERPATDINNTMDLPGGSTAVAASDVTLPINEINTTTNLTSGCSSPNVVVEINPSTSTSDLNKTDNVVNNSIVLTSGVNVLTDDGNKTMEIMQTVRPNMAVPEDASAECSDAATSNRLMNGTMELAGCAGSAIVATPTGQQNLTMEIGTDCSMTSPAVSPSIPTSAPQLNTTVNQEDGGKSTTAEVNTTIPVNHNTTVDFPNSAGDTEDLSVAARHNGTMELPAVLATPGIAKPSRKMNDTVDLVRSGSTPVTVTSIGKMNSTVDLQSTTTSTSPSIRTGVQKLTDSVVPGVNSPLVEVNSTVNFTCGTSPAVINGTVNLTSVESPCVVSTAVVDSTVNLTSSNTPCVTSVAKVKDALNLTCGGSPSVSGVQKFDNSVEMEASNRNSSPETVGADGQRDHVSQECTSPSSDATTSAARQGTEGNVPPCTGNGTVSDSATLTVNLNLSEAEVTVERSAPESRLSAQFMLDDSLDLQACSLVTSTPMPEHREFSFSRPADVFISRACEARKQLVLPTNTTITTTTTTTTNAAATSSSPAANGGHDSDSPGEDGVGGSPTESFSPTEGKEDAQACLAQEQAMMPKPTSIALPKAGGAPVAAGAAAAPGTKPLGFPIARRTIPKPMRRTGLLGVTTVANSTVEVSRHGS